MSSNPWFCDQGWDPGETCGLDWDSRRRHLQWEGQVKSGEGGELQFVHRPWKRWQGAGNSTGVKVGLELGHMEPLRFIANAVDPCWLQFQIL